MLSGFTRHVARGVLALMATSSLVIVQSVAVVTDDYIVGHDKRDIVDCGRMIILYLVQLRSKQYSSLFRIGFYVPLGQP